MAPTNAVAVLARLPLLAGPDCWHMLYADARPDPVAASIDASRGFASVGTAIVRYRRDAQPVV